MPMMISPASNEVSEIGIDRNQEEAVEKPPTQLKFESPLTAIDGVDLSTPQVQQCQ